jgi:hypothetical protein
VSEVASFLGYPDVLKYQGKNWELFRYLKKATISYLEGQGMWLAEQQYLETFT